MISDRIVVDRDRCICSERCTEAAPATFAVDDDYRVTIRPDADTSDDEAILRAVADCPTGALSLRGGGHGN